MTSLRWRTVWFGILGTFLLSWIPLNLWLQRHDSSLLHSVMAGDLVSVERAVRDGGDVQMPIRHRFTLLHVAALHTDNVAVAEFLLKHGVSLDSINDDGDSALVIAHRQGHQQMAAYLHGLKNQQKTSNKAGATQ